MKRVILFRHGEASFDSVSDFQRSLTENGITSVAVSAQQLIDANIFPQIVIASAAQRTVETSNVLCEAMKLTVGNCKYMNKLYSQGADAYISEIIGHSDDVESIMIVGHNPSVSELANHFSNDMFFQLAPAGFVVVEFETNYWNHIFSVKSNVICHHNAIAD